MSVWTDLKFMTGDAAGSMLTNFNSRIHRYKKDGNVVQIRYQRAYKSLLVFAAQRYAVHKFETEVKKQLPRFMRESRDQMRDFVREQQENNQQYIIQNQEAVVADYGKIEAKGSGGQYIVAEDKFHNPVKEALMVYYEAEKPHTFTNEVHDGSIGGSYDRQSYSTTTVCHIDLSPEVSLSSTKNVVMTQVTGRDYTRKELVSGGDLQFTVNGSIVGDLPGVYPQNKVKAFMELMQYGGILNVHHFFFGNLNVKQIIIKDFSLNKQEYMNVQPYSFTCVAVEPDEEVMLVKDTIQEINYDLQLSPMDKWYKVLLENKLAQMAVNAATQMATNVIATGLSTVTQKNDTVQEDWWKW